MSEEFKKNTFFLPDEAEYPQLLTAAARFLDYLANHSLEETLDNSPDLSDEVIAMAVHYYVKELVPIPVEDYEYNKILAATVDAEDKRKDLLALYLATCLFGYQTTGQFAGLSFGVTDKELYAAHTVVQAFYDLDHPQRTKPEATRVFYYPKVSLEMKLKEIVQERGLNVKDSTQS